MYVHGEGELLVPAHLNFGKFILDLLRKGHLDGVCLRNCSTSEEVNVRSLSTRAVNAAAALAQLGVARGDVVALSGEVSAAFLPTALAVVLTGAAFTPIELECGSAVLTHKFNLTKPKYVICTRLFWERYGDILKGLDYIKTFFCFDGVDDLESVEALAKDVDVCAFEPAVVRGDDVAMIMYSSGTTGMCKGVQLTHLSLITRFQLCKHMYNCESLNVALILFVHTSSYTFTLTLYLLSAGKTVLYGGNDIKIAQDFKVGMIMTAPRFIQDNKILGQQDNVITSLKMLYTSSAAIPLQLEQNFRERYPEVKIVNTYGACESFVATSTRDLYDGSNAESGRVGVVLPGVAVKVVDVETRKALGPEQRGEICIRSPALMKGYLGAPSPVDHQGFYPTGDLGYYDKQKRFYLVDRLADMICYKGRKVSPKDIECVLQRHPAVSEVSVVGKPADGVIMELPVAFVVLKPGAAAAAEELQEYVDKQVTWYMQLHGGVRFLPELPRNPRGKVLRRRLREILALE